MKKCPQCEFIYEDDQTRCDMDGVLLVFDSRTLPNLSALTPYPAPSPGRTPRRNRAVPAFATLILAIVLVAVYYVSVQRSAVRTTYSPADIPSTATEMPGAAAPTVEPTPAMADNPAASDQSQQLETEASDTAETPKVGPKPIATKPVKTTPAPKTTVKPETVNPEVKKEDSKEESKVGSILKKTGRILKKPFKF